MPKNKETDNIESLEIRAMELELKVLDNLFDERLRLLNVLIETI